MSGDNITLDDVIGHQEAKDAILERLTLYVNHKDVYKKAGARSPGGLLLYGAPGTGKTMLGRACYNTLVKTNPSFGYKEVKLSDLSAGNKVGEAQKKVNNFFAGLDPKKDWVLMFDEIDAICPDRLHTSSTCTLERINALLSCLDGMNGTTENKFIIGTTNRYKMIDGAIKRSGRFDDIIEICLPTLAESKMLAKKYLTGLEIDGDFDTVASALGEYCYAADWAGSDYNNLKTKLVGQYIKNDMKPLTIKEIVQNAGRIRNDDQCRNVDGTYKKK